MCARFHGGTGFVTTGSIVLALGVAFSDTEALARNNIRDAFFTVYPDAVGTVIETVPSFEGHCGVCHYEFGGGGPRNPYGARLELALPDFPSNPNGRRQAVQSIENEDSDGDGFSTLIEVTDVTTFANTPTFPGLTPANVQNVTSVDVLEIQDHLVPSTGDDVTPPQVIVMEPNSGESFEANNAVTVRWGAIDASGIAAIDLYLSDDGGVTFRPIAKGLANTGEHIWYAANRPTTSAILKVVATDNAFNEGEDDSDNAFTIYSPPGGLAPTTLRDFDLPGSQPFEAGILNPPEACAVCHGNYDNNVEPYYIWKGSMMSQASRDVLFMANMVIANQDAPDSGDLCLRCHLPRGWLQGRSVPTDGSQMLPEDESGVSCDFCHRLVDPIYDPAENPMEDAGILADLSFPASDFGNGMATIDPTGARRGPFLNAASGHPVLVSPFHREAALCGTCHDVSNPAFEKDGSGNYIPNAFDAPATDFSAHTIAPVERTYSEWFYSEYNTPDGVYAPQFGGNLDYVSTCQDCHMRDVTGQGCNFGTPPIREDLPLHDITGSSTWLPGLLGALYPGEVDEAALQDGIDRTRYMLQNAADLALAQEDTHLKVTITNNTGHKLPTGYPEGRRMWINVRFYDAGMALVSESGAYDPSTGDLGHDAEAKIYDVEPGLDEITAPLVGVDPGPSFHFVLNNKIFKDNRIPPRGFTNAAYADFGGSPVAHSYADGQYWDDTLYQIPPGAISAEVTLYYQSTSKEFIEFLRDENATNSKGQELYDLWNDNNKCPPEVMETVTITLAQCSLDADCDDGEYCNGAETCDLGTNTCQAGTPVECSDNIDCTVDTCNETSDACDHTPDDAFCDNQLYCDGTETCDPALGCQPGAPVNCNDDIDCTVDTCNDTTDACDHTPDDAFCDNELYCDGAETCDPALGCQPGAPVDCNDDIDCTIDTCNDNTDACDHTPDDAFCDNGLYCDGAETCDPVDGCQVGSPPCPENACDEENDACALNPPGFPSDPVHQALKNRYISIDPSVNGDSEIALRVDLVEMNRCAGDLRRSCSSDADCPNVCGTDCGNALPGGVCADITCTGDASCAGGTCVPTAPCVHHPDTGLSWWVQGPQQEPLGCRLAGGCTDEDWFARLGTTPHFQTWNDFGAADSSLLHISGCQITPVATYAVSACAPPTGEVCSDPLIIGTIVRPPPRHYGDVVGIVDPVTIEFTEPNQILNVTDVSGYLLTNQNYGLAGAPKPQAHWTWVDMEGEGAPFYRPQAILNVGDLNQVLFGLMGKPFSWAGNNVDPHDCQ
ncbi:MAG: hypothetical protein JSU63_20010 [Phycisphaerales bacterium]|nr:MAG: hypothetical protein JSU63_20010 [Phycisphaerales bacterium]